ncbi:hypothetical protein FMEAI12_2160005 [Parafrankia sp. Ea1.12]|nr:hypothetical protein FMEAI12_2160005 [Parafrankia sp. Ea1.12]
MATLAADSSALEPGDRGSTQHETDHVVSVGSLDHTTLFERTFDVGAYRTPGPLGRGGWPVGACHVFVLAAKTTVRYAPRSSRT